MRLERINLSWFRGAGAEATLDTELHSVVVYGANGSGKSTFVDALEYVKGDGYLAHLAHAHSGSRQRIGTRNSHAPTGENLKIEFGFQDDNVLTTNIYPDGNHDSVSSPSSFAPQVPGILHSLQILRQDSLSKFVELPGDDHLFWTGDSYSILAEIEEFITGIRPNKVFDRVLSTILFTDIVSSTEHLSKIGDKKWMDIPYI